MKKTLYVEISDKIVAYIKENTLQPGDKLPTYRKFAEQFGVSVHTVSSAMERLQYKGVVDIHPQSGIFVMEDAWKTVYKNTFNWQEYFMKSQKVRIDIMKRFDDARKKYEPSDMRYIISNLNLAVEFGSYDVWRQAHDNVLKKLSPDSLSLVSKDERELILDGLREHMSYYGIDIPSNNILLMRGTNYSLLAIALTFFSPGTICYYVSPSILDSSAYFDMCGLVRVPLPTDAEGIDIEYFSGKINKRKKAFLVVSPELAISGVTMSMRRRGELYNICYANGIPIIEIDEFRDYRSTSLPPLKAIDKHRIVFYLGTFYYTLNNATELGWIAAAPELIERITYVCISMWLGEDILCCQTWYEMHKSGEYRRYTKELQKKLRQREAELNVLLDEHLSDIATWDRNSQVFFWVRFHDHIDVQKIALNNEGLTLSEYSQYGFAANNSVFISLMGIKQENLRNAIKLLSYLARKTIKK